MQFITDTAKELLPSARKWNLDCANREAWGSENWKQYFKAIFVHLTQLDAAEPSKQKAKWRDDRLKAACQTVAKLCPHWETNEKHNRMYVSIQKELDKQNYRQDWLYAKAYEFMKSSPPDLLNSVCYPSHAILVTYHIFLSGAGKFQPFMEFLKKKTNSEIKSLPFGIGDQP